MRFGLLCAVAMPLLLRAQAPAFDVVSIKPSPAADARGPGGARLQITPGRVFGRRVTARRMVLDAYHLTRYQCSGGPGWLDNDTFDLEARSAAPASAEEMRKMLQTVLADRFQLTAHRVPKEMPVYNLTVAKGGPKFGDTFRASDGSNDPSPGRRGGPGGSAVMTDRLDMPRFAETLSANPAVGRPVLDKTGLAGVYLIHVTWHSDDDFISSVEEQLGLKLRPEKALMDILMVDRIAKPAAN